MHMIEAAREERRALRWFELRASGDTPHAWTNPAWPRLTRLVLAAEAQSCDHQSRRPPTTGGLSVPDTGGQESSRIRCLREHECTRPQELERFREAGLRVFGIAGKRDMATWGWLMRLVPQWTVIERIIAERGDSPWFYAVNDQSVREMNL
jgi:hypothetical protein